MTQDNIIKILLVDDHKVFLQGLVLLLKDFDFIKIVATCENGEVALKLLEKETVNVVVTDIDMPIMDGLKLTKEINKNYPHTNVLALSMHTSVKVVSNIIKQGITGYILKNTDQQELIEAIKTVANGEPFFSTVVKTALIEGMNNTNRKSSDSVFIELTDREVDVLKLVAAAHSQKQIAEKLCISENTVKFHKRILFSKFDVNNTMALVSSAVEKGLLD